ncbi:MAG TPA: hypothetical protein VFM46_06830 [Pseudomonadales bacterium]|nr:hypothetical protein [Pseudomonadales bacterium]
MQVSELQILIVLQLVIVLLGANFFFWLNYRRQGSYVDRLKQKMQQLAEKQAEPPAVVATNVINSSLELVGFDLDKAIADTLERFDELGVPVVPTLRPELAQFQIALLLRLEILQLEKAALEFPADAPKRKWQFLEAKLGDMVAKLKTKPRYREIAQEGKREEVLSAFTETLDVLQPEWIQYQQETGQLHPDLLNLIMQSGDTSGLSSWSGMLYSQTRSEQGADDFSLNLNYQMQSAPDFSSMLGDNSAATEMLTNIAKEQAQIISGLKHKLADLESREVDVSEYSEQIERFERLMQESDTIVKMLEAELDESLKKIHALEDQLQQSQQQDMAVQDDLDMDVSAQSNSAEELELDAKTALKEAQGMILKFAQDSMMYLKAINKLEKDNAGLAAEIIRLKGNSDMAEPGEVDEHLLNRVAELEWEYVELERRYLAAMEKINQALNKAA